MADAGVQANFVDTQQITLTNITDSLTYIQITDFETNIDSNVIKHHLTDDTVDNVFDLYDNYIQGNMWATTPQWAALVTLTVDVDGVRPSKSWQVSEHVLEFRRRNLLQRGQSRQQPPRHYRRRGRFVLPRRQIRQSGGHQGAQVLR